MIAASIAALTDEPVLSSAFSWLCKRRRGYPLCADVWDLRRRWPQEKRSLVSQLRAGRYRVDLLTRLRTKDQVQLGVRVSCPGFTDS
jgi:RNA-directed DNA polymerase